MNIFQHVWQPAITACRNCSALHAIIAHVTTVLGCKLCKALCYKCVCALWCCVYTDTVVQEASSTEEVVTARRTSCCRNTAWVLCLVRRQRSLVLSQRRQPSPVNAAAERWALQYATWGFGVCMVSGLQGDSLLFVHKHTNAHLCWFNDHIYSYLLVWR